MGSLLPTGIPFHPDTRLADQKALKSIRQDIASKGFPSVPWTERAQQAGPATGWPAIPKAF